jgi:hypothetical protein
VFHDADGVFQVADDVFYEADAVPRHEFVNYMTVSNQQIGLIVPPTSEIAAHTTEICHADH